MDARTADGRFPLLNEDWAGEIVLAIDDDEVPEVIRAHGARFKNPARYVIDLGMGEYLLYGGAGTAGVTNKDGKEGMTMRNPSASQWRAFLRHRFRAHVLGWLAIAVGLLWGYYTDLYWHEPLWAVLPAAYLAAFFFVALLVAVAAVLRIPWWLMVPLCFVSMAGEWALRWLSQRPWTRSPQPRERCLSNPFALWQGWRARRRPRRARDVSPENPGRPSGAAVIPFPAGAESHRIRSQPTHAEISWHGIGGYIAAAFRDHWKFWCYSSLLWIGLWLWLVEDMSFVAALILAIILTLIFSLLLVIPLAAALLALLSTLLFAAGMTPRQRLEATARLRLADAAKAEALAAAPQPAAQRPHWIWPLLIGLWIGDVLGND